MGRSRDSALDKRRPLSCALLTFRGERRRCDYELTAKRASAIRAVGQLRTSKSQENQAADGRFEGTAHIALRPFEVPHSPKRSPKVFPRWSASEAGPYVCSLGDRTGTADPLLKVRTTRLAARKAVTRTLGCLGLSCRLRSPTPWGCQGQPGAGRNRKRAMSIRVAHHCSVDLAVAAGFDTGRAQHASLDVFRVTGLRNAICMSWT